MLKLLLTTLPVYRKKLFQNFKVSVADSKLFEERKRTNFFKSSEQAVLLFLCQITPRWVSSDMLTALGFLGSCLALAGFLLAKGDVRYLLISIVGFAVQWFGDSLDGRIAYYRNIPRKWYGFSLDLCMDWISTVLIGLGFYYFLPDNAKILAFTYVTIYGWAIIITIIKFKINDSYTIDTGYFGPTEFRIGICVVLLFEILFPGTLNVFAGVVNCILLVVSILKFKELLQLGNARDKDEKRSVSEF